MELANIVRNEREYRITRSLLRQFERAIEQLDDVPDLPAAHRAVVAAGYRRKLAELRRQVSQYEALKSGKLPSVSTGDLSEVGRALIAARIARNWTQADLARALGVKPQQVQKYESSDYASASLDRLAAVASALGAELNVRIAFHTGARAPLSRPRRARNAPGVVAHSPSRP